MQLFSVKQDRKKEAYKMITKKMTAALLCLALVLGMLTAATFSSQIMSVKFSIPYSSSADLSSLDLTSSLR